MTYKTVITLLLAAAPVFASCAAGGQAQTVSAEVEPGIVFSDAELLIDIPETDKPKLDAPESVPVKASPAANTDSSAISPGAIAEEAEAASIDYITVQPNEAGEIPIIMYHGIDAENPGRYDRKTSDFEKDLQALYEGGFRLVPLSDALSGNIDLPAGSSPVVLTFDDAKKSSFSLEEKDGELVPAEGCAVEIIERFNESHPGFGTAATFFIIGCDEPFRGSAGTVGERLGYLAEHGYEIGNHTFSHSNMKTLDAARVQEELSLTNDLLLSLYPALEINAVAYPQGVAPDDAVLGYVLNGEHNGSEYSYSWGLNCAPGKTSANPFNTHFNPLTIPRIRPTDDSREDPSALDLWYYIRKYEREPWLKYISDGRPETVAVHEGWKHLVNEDALGDKKLVVWNEESGNSR